MIKFEDIFDEWLGEKPYTLEQRKIQTDMMIHFEKFISGIMSEMTIWEKDSFMRVFKRYCEKQKELRNAVDKLDSLVEDK